MKILTLKMYNTVTDKEVISFSMPIDPYKCMKGSYSKYFAKTKENMASHQKVSKSKIKIVFSIGKGKNDRWVMMFANGFGVDLPSDITDEEIDIVIAQANVLRMPFDIKEAKVIADHRLKTRRDKRLNVCTR